MRIICTAVLDNDMQKDNLAQCVRILGGVPTVNRSTVCVEYDGSPSKAEKFIKLFEQFSRHEIKTITDIT